MNSLNKVQLIGNVTRDPELKQTKSGQGVTTVGMATNRVWKDQNGVKHDEVEYHNVVCWGRLAEVVCEYIKKGTKIFFGGRLQTRTWDDESGVKHYRTEVVAEDMIILSSKSDFNGSAGDSLSDDSGSSVGVMEGEDISAEDLPF